jgi:radical SAM superfamily enzyme YgiQ (UPF0313 family)
MTAVKSLLVQPPFVQLNAPYPAIHCLETFLKSRGVPARSFDHSIEVYRHLFSRAGLERVFAGVESAWAGGALAKNASDDTARDEIERCLSQKDFYLAWADGILDFLSGGDPAFAHRLASAVELPLGARARAFLEAADGRIRAEEARGLATRILEDLADLIRFALDPDFDTVRYGERLARSRGDFGQVEASLDASWFIRSVYGPWLEGFWAERKKEAGCNGEGPDESILVLVTIPFPGCLAGALACARAARSALGPRAVIAFGGGYVSTELRGLTDARIFSYCDWLVFDSGYAGLASILDRLEDRAAPLHGVMFARGGRVVGEGFDDEGSRGDKAKCGDEVEGEAAAGGGAATPERIEFRALRSNHPDYASADFGRYLRVVDDENPMHRLWSDSPWLKYALAHGCYWRKCEFCDTGLDYVAHFVPADVGALAAAADAASRRHGIYGIHFVDEAMPMASLLAFARVNRDRAARGLRPFHFWGNVRFDASWTQDRCEFLAATGLSAVSGGVEIATEGGLAMTNKGFDLPALVRCLVAMRRAGLLVHAYLIYGFPGQPDADIAASAETVRQLFAAGLVDSAFWHRFVLTRHSRMMAEYRRGGRPGLRPIDRAMTSSAGGPAASPPIFAANDLEFEGEADFDRFDAPLAAALDAWMAGEGLDRPAADLLAKAGLDRRASRPAPGAAAPGLVEALIAKAEAELDAARSPAASGPGTSAAPVGGRAYWIAGRPLLAPSANGADRYRITWSYRGELGSLELTEEAARRLAELLADSSRPDGLEAADFLALAERAGLAPGGAAMARLRSAGLVFA